MSAFWIAGIVLVVLAVAVFCWAWRYEAKEADERMEEMRRE